MSAPPGRRVRMAIHATAVAVGEAGVLIRGRSRAGKSSLALALMTLGAARGFRVRLVGDDRVYVAACDGSVVVEPHPAILGMIERRGAGILTVPYQARAVVRLVVDFVEAGGACDIQPRAPDEVGLRAPVAGIELPRIELRSGTSPHDAAEEVVRCLLDMKLPK